MLFAIEKTLTPGEIVNARIELLPIAVRIPAGASLRLVIAGADADHFETVTAAETLTVLHLGSSLELPIAASPI